MRNRNYFTIFCLCFIAWSFGPAISANASADAGHATVPLHWNPDFFMGSWEIKPGMKGVAKTVIFGTRIDEFELTVIQVAHGRGFDNRPMLLCRAEGWVVDFTGGIAGGMSGSPVYIEGKLAGAVSGHWSNTDQKTCIVTPIDQMLFAFEHNDRRFNPISLAPPGTRFDASPYILDFAYPHTENAGSLQKNANETLISASISHSVSDPFVDTEYFDLDSAVEFEGKVITELAMASAPGRLPVQKSGLLFMEMCATPMVVGGSSPELAKMFANSLQEDSTLNISLAIPFETGDMYIIPASEIESMRDLVPAQILEEIRYSSNVTAPAILEPGCVLGVRTVRGDLSSFGYGTLTYIDNNGNFLAYGHRSGRRGEISLPVSNGFVYYVSANWQRVGKNAVCLETVGTLYQDRGAAVAGTIGHKPAWIPVTVYSRDIDNGETSKINCEAANGLDVLPQAASSIVSAGLGYAAARSANGTVTALFSVESKNFGQYKWRSVYLADAALGAGGGEIRAFLDAAMFGEGESVIVKSVDAWAETTHDRRSFRIAEVRSLNSAEFDKLALPDSRVLEVPAGEDFGKSFPAVRSDVVTDGKLIFTHDGIGRVHLMIRLVPFNSELNLWMPVTVTVPIGLFGKSVRMQVYGGGGLSNPVECGQTAFDRERTAQRKHIIWKRSAEGKSKAEWLHEFTLSPRGQHLIVEFVYSGKPKELGLSEMEDLPSVRRVMELSGVVSGYTESEALFK